MSDHAKAPALIAFAGSIALALAACGEPENASGESSSRSAPAAPATEDSSANASAPTEAAAIGEAAAPSAGAAEAETSADGSTGDGIGADAADKAINANNEGADDGSALENKVATANSAASSAAASAAGAATAEQYAALVGDAAKGKKVFVRCMTCHTVQDGQNRVGPSLYGILGRPAGTVANFKYSKANKNSGIVWSEEIMFEYLENPPKFMPGTLMAFPGLPAPQDRADVIAYMISASQ